VSLDNLRDAVAHRPPSIAVVGSINTDLVAKTHRLPRAGETVSSKGLQRLPGGKGLNQAIAAARQGADVRFYGRVGKDAFALKALEEEHVNVSTVIRDDGESGVALIVVDESGENTIVVEAGANGRMSADDVAVGDVDAVLCQLEIPIAAIAAAARQASFFCLNAAPARHVADDLINDADLVVVNRFELETLTTTPALTALTLGPEGAVLLEDGVESVRARAPRVDTVDGTAAGDAFCGVFLVSLLEGRDPEEALRRGCVGGAIAASRFGAAPSLPTAQDIDWFSDS
jgi:ribokinase